MAEKVVKSDAEWKAQLTEDQFEVTRRAGTERAFTGEHWDSKEKGRYLCVCCGAALFVADAKYDSGTGWPSFFEPVDPAAVDTNADHSLGALREEVVCSHCDAHLGHVFPDGPAPTGQRYCMNSASLRFEKEGEGGSD